MVPSESREDTERGRISDLAPMHARLMAAMAINPRAHTAARSASQEEPCLTAVGSDYSCFGTLQIP